MTWGTPSSFPRAILHIDGDAFFAACEVAKNPKLRGKPVITGKERGIVSAATYEAKALGIKRGMRLTEVRQICPEAIILPSDYETYSLFSERMYAIARRYTPTVEEYGIDECFADITGLRRSLHLSYTQTAAKIKDELEQELGMTFSIGLSVTKTLAKIGSKWNKPSGLTSIPLKEARRYLSSLPVGHVWGIGPQTAAYLNQYSIKTAYDLAKKDEAWVKHHISKPFYETWQELNGKVTLELESSGRTTYESMSKTRTFTPPSKNPGFIYAQLSKNVENVCIKARRWKLVAPKFFFFLKTQDFRFHGCEISLTSPSANPITILKEIQKHFMGVLRPGEVYRATGITLINLTEEGATQLDLFGTVEKGERMLCVFKNVDELAAKYGKHVVFLGSSYRAMKFSAHEGERGDKSERVGMLFKGETARKRLAIPMLGEAR